jgi:hypothetical protein
MKAEVVVERSEAIVTTPDVEVEEPDPQNDGGRDYRETGLFPTTIPQATQHAVSEAGD